MKGVNEMSRLNPTTIEIAETSSTILRAMDKAAAYKAVRRSLLKTGEATHKNLEFELDDITQTCDVYADGDYLTTLDSVSDIWDLL